MTLNCGVGEELLRVPWTARRSNPSILKEINPKYSLEGLTLKLKLYYFGHLMEELAHWKRPWCWERLRARGEGEDRGWDDWVASPTQRTWVWASSERWWRTAKPGLLQFTGSQKSDMTERLNNNNPQGDEFWRRLSHKGGVLISGISAHMKETPESSIIFSTRWEYSGKMVIYGPGSQFSSDTEYASPLTLDFQASRTVRNECLLETQIICRNNLPPHITPMTW